MAHAPHPGAKSSMRSLVSPGRRRQRAIRINCGFRARGRLAHSRHVGILGEDYPGYFTVGDTRELRRLLIRAEADPDFLSLLRSRVDELAELFEPARERRAWKDLLGELKRPSSSVQPSK